MSVPASIPTPRGCFPRGYREPPGGLPAGGNLRAQWSRIEDAYMATQYYRIEWASQCDCCPAQRKCTRSKSGCRILVVGLRHDLVQKDYITNGRYVSAYSGSYKDERSDTCSCCCIPVQVATHRLPCSAC